MQDSRVEKQTLPVDGEVSDAHINQARLYLKQHLTGKTRGDGLRFARRKPWLHDDHLSPVVRMLVAASVSFDHGDDRALIVKGQDLLLKTWFISGNTEMAGDLWYTLDAKETLLALFDLVRLAGGVQIFMGISSAHIRSHNFAAVMAPYVDAASDDQGVVGVLGPVAMDYRRIVPMVNYTAGLLSRTVKDKKEPL